ncbi:hypothetical protein ASPZODRAFT_19819 [Penicilliopsis zonata CBS 506.65]|uniref:Mpv17/PMP22 family protein n=1 Tax=Penicilliopsis zonata CBS 506.65 TaxID=1073090 RepID=A0A1L9S7I0_9EURO|nr:hypothetical protein ASPZODRAFT_19819 [Penicilliopsis zonata CBS 506.65]OJJ43127.1 hypothetical protein ASPZODRAFT_19819 [Penicilliopsis zonata CBS 506.65]
MSLRSPLTATFIQATILNAIANVSAQVIDQYKNGKPLALNALALLQFITYGILIVPINFAWQKAIEARFPGHIGGASTAAPPAPAAQGIPLGTAGEDVKEKPSPKKRHSKWVNFTIKFLLDMIVGGIMNILLFVVLINLLKGATLSQIIAFVKADFWPIWTARLKFRPIVSGLLYTVVPVDRRVVFGSACGVIWGIYLSLYAAV